MIDATAKPTHHYFIDEGELAAFNAAFAKVLSMRQKEVVAQFIAPQNMQRLRHGGMWLHPGAPETGGGDVKEHAAVVETTFQDLVDNNLDVIEDALQHFSEAMHRQFSQSIYGTVQEACDKTGNTVSAKDAGSLDAAFMAVIEKIEFAADKDGNVQFPELHMHPEVAGRMIAALEAAPPEFKARLDALTARKSAEAIDRERTRKARFVKYGGDK